MTKLSQFSDHVIWLTFFGLSVLTPLLFSTKNSELFEIPKMLFVYLGAVIILTGTLLKFAASKKIQLPKNLILVSLLIFLAFNLASTVTSIDKFTSIYGYPSRLNGGVISLIAYLIVFSGGLINLNVKKVEKLLVATVISALVVAFWGIPGHFGKDPNCFVLTGQLTSSCWQAEFNPTLRIFSTLGQPNWLASYLVLIIPISLALTLISKKPIGRIFFAATTLVIFLAFVFTNSISGLIGSGTSLVIFLLLLGIKKLKDNAKILGPLLLTFILLIVFLGSILISRTKETVQTNIPTLNIPASGSAQASGAQTPTITDSGKIRLIVWDGALQVFKNNPLLGTGPETFAYSYYKVRPKIHNQTAEWNFFYNKAHNEFLNYLANLGILGFIAYLTFLLATLYTLFKIQKSKDRDISILSSATLAAIVGYQTTIFFGFSVVATQLLMFLLIAYLLIFSKDEKTLNINLGFLKTPAQILCFSLIGILGLWLIILNFRLYFSDLFIEQARGLDFEQIALDTYDQAINTYPSRNPFYLADSSYAQAAYLQNLKDPNQVKSHQDKALTQANSAISVSSNNLLIARRVANSYFLIATTNQLYESKATDVAQKMLKLAPTDPQTYLASAKIYAGFDKKEEAQTLAQKAIDLKPDYQEAKDLLDQLK